MATTTTVRAVAERVCDQVFAGRSPVKVTATSGAAATTVISTSASFNKQNVNAYDGVQVACTLNASGAGTSPENESRLVTSFAEGTGTWTVLDYGGVTQVSDTFLFLYGITLEDLFSAISETNIALNLPRYVALTGITNGDAESVTGWTAVGGGAIALETTVVRTGTGSIKCTPTGTGEGVKSAQLHVRTNTENVLVSCVVRVPHPTAPTTIDVILYDVTNSAAIYTVPVTGTDWTEVRFRETLPPTCEDVEIRILSNGSGTDPFYVDYAAIYSNLDREYLLPASINDLTKVNGVFFQEHAATAQEDNDTYIPESGQWEPFPVSMNWRDDVGVNSSRITLATTPDRAIFVKFTATGSAVSTFGATLNGPEDVYVAGAIEQCYKKLGLNHRRRGQDGMADDYERMALIASAGYVAKKHEFGLDEPRMTRHAQRRVAV